MNKVSFRIVFVFLLLMASNSLVAQKKSTKKYPALLWEISGNGLKHKSYLFGTMHVSNKKVFNLSDSFFYALKSVDKVGLELNPDHWQEDMTQADNEKEDLQKYTSTFYRTPINSGSLKLEKYDSWLTLLLKVQPSIINNLLYRNYNKYDEDNEEDTFLDLYIYQAGKKLGKQATGMEQLKISDMSQVEAYRDMLKEKKKAKDVGSTNRLSAKVEEAYRKQDLDELDSLEKIMLQSDAYIARFLYARNIVQANSMDTVLKKGFSLFVGVGCAHLPGDKGVIELLRKKGYKLRPVIMGERDVKQKEEIAALHAPVYFKTFKSQDGAFQVNMPGTPYSMNDSRVLNNTQYSDMSNGSYYLISRLRTHASLIGGDVKKVIAKLDSLLYESIPGKILSKKDLVKNGYKGYDITNKTRRGDVQRYQLFVLPEEIIMFKMSGPADYILTGTESDQFFNSIQLKETTAINTYQLFHPATADFTVEVPVVLSSCLNKKTNDNLGRWEYEGSNPQTDKAYAIWHVARFSLSDIKSDSTDLELMNLSVYHSEPVQAILNKRYVNHKGYASMQATFKLTDSSYLFVQHIIRGVHQYSLFYHSTTNESDNRFFSSMTFTPFKYKAFKDFSDNISAIKCKTPVTPKLDTAFRRVYNEYSYAKANFVNGVEKEQYWQPKQFIKLVDDSTMEAVFIQTRKLPLYFYTKNKSKFWDQEINYYYDSTSHILKSKKAFQLEDGTSGYELMYTDTGSTKLVKARFALKNNYLVYTFTIVASNEPESEFINTTFNSVKPFIAKSTESILVSKLPAYFKDFYSNDEKIKTRARNWISNIRYDYIGTDALMKAYRTYGYEEKDFYENKTRLISEFGYLEDSTKSARLINKLNTLYEWSADTSMFQNKVILAMARLRNKEVNHELKNWLIMDPPIFEDNQELRSMFGFFEDSLVATKELFPEILQLVALDDYKEAINNLLVLMVDSNKLTAKEYETYFSKLFFDAKINLKKQFSTDEEMIKSLSDKDEQEANRSKKYYNPEEISSDVKRDFRLLAPFYSSNPIVKKYFDKAFKSKNNLVQLYAVVALAKYKIAAPDSVLLKLAANRLYAFNLYQLLGSVHATVFFPTKFNTQEHLMYSQLFYKGEYKLVDTVVFLKRVNVEAKKVKGVVNVYKYRLDNDGPWYFALCGIQPSNVNQTNYNDIISAVKTQIDDKQPLQKQIDKAVSVEVLKYLTNSSNFFMRNSSASMDD